MKAENLKSARIYLDITPDCVAMVMPGGMSDAVEVFYGDESDFDHAKEALRVAALCRAAYEMQQALQALLDEQNDAPLETRRPQWEAAMKQARAALALSENTNETVTP